MNKNVVVPILLSSQLTFLFTSGYLLGFTVEKYPYALSLISILSMFYLISSLLFILTVFIFVSFIKYTK